MTDGTIQPTEPLEPLSTTLESDVAPKASGGGKVDNVAEVSKPEAPVKNESVRDSLKAELDKTKEPEKPEAPVKAEKVEKESVPVVKTGEKSAAPEEEDDASERVKVQQAERKSENRERPEPPARFLPRAKELWRSTPNEVQSEVSRIVREHEEETRQYQESHKFREELREYEDLGKQHGVSIKQALDNYVGIERKFAEAPSEGFRQLLSNINMQPQQAISHILRAFNVTPQQLASHINADPNSYVSQQPQRQHQQVQPQHSPEVDTLKQQITAMQAQMTHQQYIEPFIQDHPRYHELEQDIAFFLSSGKIPSNLSPADKLAAAYDMAERINPSSNVESFESKRNTTDRRVDEDFNGTKSIKSSPGNVLEVKEPEKKMSTREMLEDELKKLKRASGA